MSGLEIVTRLDLLKLVESLHLDGVGVEVGVWEGEFSERILQHTKLSLLWSIDCWAHHVNGSEQGWHDQKYILTVARLAPYLLRSRVVRCRSREAANFIADGLDFVYLDAGHYYEAVAQDLLMWYPKVRKGGIIAGHDYLPDGNYGWIEGACQVKSAVDDFVRKNNLSLALTTEPECKTWYIVK